MKRAQTPRVLFLYTELAEYIRSCFDALAEAGVEVHVVAYPINPEAPFAFDNESSPVHYHRREELNLTALMRLVEEIDPETVFCSGWIDSEYVEICRRMRKELRTVLISDNALTGRIRSYVSALRARIRYKPIFREAFVPGAPQVAYARWMSFAEESIHTGFYTVDPERYASLSEANVAAGREFPKRFVFAGRHVEFKGLRELWKAYSRLQAPGWELHCIGTGPLYDTRPVLPGLFHHGFVQPAEMDNFVAQGGVFVLPSHKEPWGMVVHEFASAGYPLLCSDQVGAASAFLAPSKNGFTFRAQSVESLQEALEKIVRAEAETLRSMARTSLELSKEITVQKWVDTVKSKLIQNHE